MHACVLSCFSHVWLFATLWTVALQAPLSLGFSRQEYWSGLPWPSPGDLPDPGIKPRSPALQADFLLSKPPEVHDKCVCVCVCVYMRACMLSHFSCVRLFVTSGTVARQAPLSVGLSRQKYWGALPCPPTGELPDPGIEPMSSAAPALQVDSSLLSHLGNPCIYMCVCVCVCVCVLLFFSM